MTTEATATDKALAAQGATTENLDAGAITSGDGIPKAPAAPSNEPPKPAPKKDKPEGMDEEHGTNKDEPAPTAEDKAAAEATAKAAADKKAADEKEAAGPLKDYVDFSDSPAAAAAVNLLKEAGIGPNEANGFFEKALKSGDLKDVDVKGLEAKLGKDKATLVMAGVEAHYTALAAKQAASVKAVHEVFNGEQNWKTVRDWAHAAEKADPQVKAQIDAIRGMIDEGGFRAEAGARELLRMYNAAPNKKGLGTNKLAVGDSTGTVIGTHLTRADYLTTLKAAHARGASQAEIQAIDARRRAGKAAGI
jgi:hypothetical protein